MEEVNKLGKILIVDDNEDVLFALNLLLEPYTEGFNRKVYLSVPLWAYAGKLHKGDKIVFNIHTYKEGMTSRIFYF